MEDKNRMEIEKTIKELEVLEKELSTAGKYSLLDLKHACVISRAIETLKKVTDNEDTYKKLYEDLKTEHIELIKQLSKEISDK